MIVAQLDVEFKLEPLPVDIIGSDGQVTAIIDDGYHENLEIEEWEIILDGQIVGYASDEATARRRYNEALRIRRAHAVAKFYQ